LHVRSYLSIQKLRYGDILEYEINIPDELTYCRVPKITLQPLVENALYHGIKSKRGKGRIKINGIFKDGNLILAIEDNGLGMKPERLKQVIDGIYDNDENNKNFFGLYNVNKRIQLYYGTEFGIRMESTYEEGTRVEVIIPFSTDKETTATQIANNSVLLQNGGCNK
jgi:two-component system sensor histidine kinase YesM